MSRITTALSVLPLFSAEAAYPCRGLLGVDLSGKAVYVDAQTVLESENAVIQKTLAPLFAGVAPSASVATIAFCSLGDCERAKIRATFGDTRRDTPHTLGYTTATNSLSTPQDTPLKPNLGTGPLSIFSTKILRIQSFTLYLHPLSKSAQQKLKKIWVWSGSSAG